MTKPSFILFAFIAIVFVACQKEAANNFLLTGHLKGIKQGTLYLQKIEDSTLVSLDSFVFNGQDQFTLKTQLAEPEMLYLVLDRGLTNSLDNSLQFFAEPNPMTLHTTLERFYADAVFEGSENQKLFETYTQFVNQFRSKNLEQFEQQFRAQKLNKPKRVDSIQNLIDRNNKRLYLYAINFALANKDKAVAPYVAVTSLTQARTKFLDTIYKQLPAANLNSKYGKMLESMILERQSQNIP